MRRLLAAGVLAAGLLLGGCSIPRTPSDDHTTTTTTGEVNCLALGCPGSPGE